MTRPVPVLGCMLESVDDLWCSELARVVFFRVVSPVLCEVKVEKSPIGLYFRVPVPHISARSHGLSDVIPDRLANKTEI